MQKQLTEVADRIETNVLGRLMHGQRELFHSNLLGWFFDALPEAADAVFRPFTSEGSVTERAMNRERNNLDLVMTWPGRTPLVIENKVFSVPDLAQLNKYEKKTERWDQKPSLMLLSTIPPGFPSGQWKHVSYKELGEKILNALPDNMSYEVETMRHYAQLALDLDFLMDQIGVDSEHEGVHISDEELSAFHSSQVRKALQKTRAELVCQHIGRTLPSIATTLSSGLDHGEPRVSSLTKTSIDGLTLHVGWQYQGGKFARGVAFGETDLNGRGEELRLRRFDVCRAHPELFSFPDSLPVRSHQGRNEFDRYDPNYVYQKVPARELTVGQLIEAAVAVHQSLKPLFDN